MAITGEKIIFPVDYEQYCRLGFEAFDRKDYKTALNDFKEAYELSEDHTIHRLMVYTYMELEDYQAAKQVLLEHRKDYLTTGEDVMLYVDLLLKTREWITAHYVIADYKTYYAQLAQQETKLKMLEEADHLYRADEIKQQKQQLQVSSSLTRMEQMTLWKEAVYLPLEDYVEVVSATIPLSTTPLLIRATLLESLQHMCWSKSVQYLDFNEKLQEVQPSEIVTIQKAKHYQQFDEYCREALQHMPTIWQDIQAIMPLIYVLLLPDPDAVITSPKSFGEAFLVLLGLRETSSEKPEVQKALSILMPLFQEIG